MCDGGDRPQRRPAAVDGTCARKPTVSAASLRYQPSERILQLSRPRIPPATVFRYEKTAAAGVGPAGRGMAHRTAAAGGEQDTASRSVVNKDRGCRARKPPPPAGLAFGRKPIALAASFRYQPSERIRQLAQPKHPPPTLPHKRKPVAADLLEVTPPTVNRGKNFLTKTNQDTTDMDLVDEMEFSDIFY